MSNAERERIERAAADLVAARLELEAAIRAGREAGMQLKDLAAASGRSIETVRQISMKGTTP